MQAREALNKWKKIEQIFLNEERQKENYFLDKDNSINEEELFPIEENKEININLRNLDNNTKNKKIKNNIKYMKNKEIKDAEKEDIKINNLNNNKKFINKYNNINLNNNNRIKNENGLNEISLLKESLTKIISESVLNSHNYINNKIKSKLDIMEKRINNLENKISKLNNNNKKSNITLESQINNIWLECLDLINQNKMNEAYDLILSTKDDIYLLRLMCLTGPILNSLNENLAKNVLVRINMINRGKQINDILIKFVEESINNKNNIFKKLEYKEQNDILDSLFNIFKNKSNNNLTIKAQDLYNLIIEQSKQNNNQ